MKKNILVPLIGAVVLGLGAYVGYHTYDAYAETNESDMLLANAEALASGENGSYTSWSCDASSYVPCFFKCEYCRIEISGTGRGHGSHGCGNR